MARSRSLPVNVAAGTYGPFAIDSFTRDDADGVLVRYTQPPGGFPPFRVTVDFTELPGQVFEVSYSGGIAFEKDGITPLAEGSFRVDIPREVGEANAKGKRAVTRADVMVILGGAYAGTINIEAI